MTPTETSAPDLSALWAAAASTSTAPWSGRARYAAAMGLYQQDAISAEALEAFRICARLDAEDVLALLPHRPGGAEAARRIRDHRQ